MIIPCLGIANITILQDAVTLHSMIQGAVGLHAEVASHTPDLGTAVRLQMKVDPGASVRRGAEVVRFFTDSNVAALLGAAVVRLNVGVTCATLQDTEEVCIFLGLGIHLNTASHVALDPVKVTAVSLNVEIVIRMAAPYPKG